MNETTLFMKFPKRRRLLKLVQKGLVSKPMGKKGFT